ncbi:MAG: hypothetical protein AB7P03_19520 [Kofleriaceae bacterium]
MRGTVVVGSWLILAAACSGRHDASVDAGVDLSGTPDAAEVSDAITTDPEHIYGVTIDSIDDLDDIVDSLAHLSRKPTTRIVFDENVPATDYTSATIAIHDVSHVMGELLDSFYVSDYSVEEYRDRAEEYFAELGDHVDIWEIGNEINGEWLGDTKDVVAKMTAAYELAEQQGRATALTLYLNPDCWEDEDHEMFAWAGANVPPAMKQGLDYVFVSYYEDDCNDFQPDWNAVFAQLAVMFPTAKLGVGECGTDSAPHKAEFIERYYSLEVTEPRYIGGSFWWYFHQDMVPRTKPLWTTLDQTIAP